ncbi:hypothetical protein SE2072C2_02520 [Salmonella enterica]|nr:hypothetical protein SE2072C2_02520 [Salmonella enterica]
MGVLAQIRSRLNIKISKVAAATAGHEDFTSWLLAIIDEQHAATRLSCLRGAKHARCASAYNNGIKPFHVAFLSQIRAGIVKFPQWSHQREKRLKMVFI